MTEYEAIMADYHSAWDAYKRCPDRRIFRKRRLFNSSRQAYLRLRAYHGFSTDVNAQAAAWWHSA
jgi:hypothetical protein